MCLQSQGIDNNNGIVGSVRQARGISNNNRDVGRGQVIDYAPEVLEITTEAARIQGQKRILQRCNDRPEKLAITTEALAE